MIVGFTGTRSGLTEAQRETLKRVLHIDWSPVTSPPLFIHGDCVGADAEAATLAYEMGYIVIAHPSDIPAMTAHTLAHERHEPKPPLERNRDIVNECNMLVACPKGYNEERRSGTWSTIRYAQRVQRPLFIVWPDGTTNTTN